MSPYNRSPLLMLLVLVSMGCGGRTEFNAEEVALFREAQENFAEVQFDSALEALDRIRARNVETVGLRARIHFHTKQYEQAEKILRDGLGKWPENPYLMLWLGRTVFIDAERGAEATEIFRRMVMNDPGNSIARYHLGRCFEREKKMELAFNQYYNALGIEHEISRVHLHLADLFTGLQMQDRAEMHARKVAALNVNPSDVAAVKALKERGRTGTTAAAPVRVQEKKP